MKILTDLIVEQIIEFQKKVGLKGFGSKLSDYEVIG